jgi:hypothetical protein
VYGISNITVTSPDPGVATQFSSQTTESQGGREAELNVRIGDPNQTISAPTATYVISYDVTGAMRSFNGYDELYWDSTGFGNPLIKQLQITTTVPGGAQDATCFAGPPRSTTPCQTQNFTKGGQARFAQTNVAPGQNVTVGIKITPGLVADNKPHMEPSSSKLSPAAGVGALTLAAVTLLIAVGSPIVGVLWWRKNGRDQRYADQAPGTTPLPGQQIRVVPNDSDIPIPVAFSHEQMQDSVRNQVAARGWFRKVPSAAAISGLGFAMIAFAVFAVLGVGFWIAWTRALPRVLLLLIPLLPIIITVAVIRTKLKRGQRTAEGRAICDQVEGLWSYLATAEAAQLKFEEGEDIFSKYLPWAIIFELADRWAKICGELVAMGRLPNETPYWYIGNYQMTAFNTAFLTSSLTSAATPVASSSVAAGTGFGGGGFSGGGGGGGGTSGW